MYCILVVGYFLDMHYQYMEDCLYQYVHYNRFKDASAICQVLNNKQDWEELGKACITCLNLELGG